MSQNITRRNFITATAAAAGGLCLPWQLAGFQGAGLERVRFGLCADPHQDVMHDGEARLSAFIDRATEENVDFILQLGDFCRPYPHNRGFMNVWESFKGSRFHVIGNHDTDGGFTREQVLEYWQMPARFYTFDRGGFHFIVLDGNDVLANRAPGYPRAIAADQIKWLQADLASCDQPVIIFSHQSLEDPGGVENGAEIRQVLEEANRSAGYRKVVACISGHHHIDYHRKMGGIDYLQINSMSYYWLGNKHLKVRYSPEVDKNFPYIKYTAPYRDSVYAIVTLEAEGSMTIEGLSSEFVGPSPWELGFRRGDWQDRVVPQIRDRKFAFGVGR